ncbi:MAG: hypothetical protein ACOZCP_21395 [Pseudomonadota bacterium]
MKIHPASPVSGSAPSQDAAHVLREDRQAVTEHAERLGGARTG